MLLQFAINKAVDSVKSSNTLKKFDYRINCALWFTGNWKICGPNYTLYSLWKFCGSYTLYSLRDNWQRFPFLFCMQKKKKGSHYLFTKQFHMWQDFATKNINELRKSINFDKLIMR